MARWWILFCVSWPCNYPTSLFFHPVLPDEDCSCQHYCCIVSHIMHTTSLHSQIKISSWVVQWFTTRQQRKKKRFFRTPCDADTWLEQLVSFSILFMSGSHLVEMKTVPPAGSSMCVQPTERMVNLTRQAFRRILANQHAWRSLKNLWNNLISTHCRVIMQNLPSHYPGQHHPGVDWDGAATGSHWVIGIQPKSF